MLNLTKDEIEKLEPGRELDALIALEVFGENVKHNWHWKHTCPEYSTDIEAAWMVVEAMGEKYKIFSLVFVHPDINRESMTEDFCLRTQWSVDFQGSGAYRAARSTIASAICIAALLAAKGGAG